MLERAVQILLTLAVGIVLARSLGPRNFGVFSFAIALAGLFLPLVEIGQGVVVRDLVAAPESRSEILGSAFALQACTATVATAALVAIAQLLVRDQLARPLVTILALAFLAAPMYVVDFWFQAELRARQASMARTAALTLSSALKVAAVWITGSLLWLGAATAVETLLGAPLMLWVYVRSEPGVRTWHLSRARLSSLVRRSLPLTVAGLSIAVYMQIDQVMLGAMSSSRQVGLYAVVTRISEASYFVAVAIVASEAPGLARLRQSDRRRYQQRISRMLAYLAAGALVFTVPVVVFSSRLITILFGTSFRGAAPVLTVHVLSTVFVFLGVGASPWTVNEGTQNVVMALTSVGAVVNVLLNLWLIPTHGAMGAAYATLIAYAIAGVVGNIVHGKTRSLFWMQIRSLNLVRTGQIIRHDIRTRMSEH